MAADRRPFAYYRDIATHANHGLFSSIIPPPGLLTMIPTVKEQLPDECLVPLSCDRHHLYYHYHHFHSYFQCSHFMIHRLLSLVKQINACSLTLLYKATDTHFWHGTAHRQPELLGDSQSPWSFLFWAWCYTSLVDSIYINLVHFIIYLMRLF